MLMAAVTSTSLVTDTTSTRPAASGHTESSGMSFIQSFTENAVAAGEKSSDVAGETKQGNVVESVVSTPGKTASAAGSAMSVTRTVKDTSEDVKSLAPLRTGTGTGHVANKASANIASAVPQHSVKLSGAHAASQIMKSDDQPEPVASESEISQGQKLTNGTADGSMPDGPEETAVPVPQIEVSVAGSAIDGTVKQVLTGKEAVFISGQGQTQDSAGTVAKDHGTSPKTEKGAKAEAKQDKKDKAGIPVSAVAVDVKPSVLAQVLVNPIGTQPPLAKDVEADVLQSTSVVTSGRSSAIVVAANGKNSKAAANTGKPDGSTVKTPGASIENPLSQKAETDGTKPEMVIAANLDADKSKLQTTVVSMADSGQLRTISIVSSSAPGVVSGNGPAHNAGVGLHTTESISHVVATAQTSSNCADTPAPVDAAHKTLTATPTSLEVGVSDGTHGWLKIRAEMADGGSVNTSLSTSSPAGQEMLHRELPSLAAYLKSEHIAVNAVVVQPMPASAPDTRGNFAANSGGEHGQAQESGSQGRDGRQSPANPTPAHVGASESYSNIGTVGENELFSSASYVQGGGWLSVRA
jgi:hypothetical protein